MKVTIKPIVWVVILITELAACFYEFASSDPIQYYSQKKSRLIVVASIGLLGGLLAFAFSKLSSQNRHRVKLLTLCLAACLLTAFAGYFSFDFFSLVNQIGPSQLGLDGILKGFMFIPLLPILASTLLWLICIRAFKRRVQ
ncbi:MAG: hypothetical protein U1F83_12770 [Verrucomicrobiota bacterium]